MKTWVCRAIHVENRPTPPSPDLLTGAECNQGSVSGLRTLHVPERDKDTVDFVCFILCIIIFFPFLGLRDFF